MNTNVAVHQPKAPEQASQHQAQLDEGAVRAFSYRAKDEELADLQRRIRAARLPEKEPVPDHSQGVQLATVTALADYWASEYDWRNVEARINALPNFVTEIDGLDIHFIHARSRHTDALPIILTHGWPGSIVWYLKVVPPLIDPTSHGGRPSDAFHVVLPSMPGYGFSGKPTSIGWGPSKIAQVWALLMQRLGYDRFVAQGGDWGGIITDLMGAQANPGLIAIHSNMPGTVPEEIDKLLWAGSPPPAELTEEERRAYEQLASVYKQVHYAFYMAARPQALVALADSPVGLATFLSDPLQKSLELIARAFAGEEAALTRDDILDNITLFWLTNTAVSAARLYRENTVNYFTPKGVSVPAAVSVFPDELYQAPRSWAAKAYPQLIHYNKVEKGGHFAAWEQPEIFVAELRAAFHSTRGSPPRAA